jgi:hypothetical protein
LSLASTVRSFRASYGLACAPGPCLALFFGIQQQYQYELMYN